MLRRMQPGFRIAHLVVGAVAMAAFLVSRQIIGGVLLYTIVSLRRGGRRPA
jgi:hypothetical protein